MNLLLNIFYFIISEKILILHLLFCQNNKYIQLIYFLCIIICLSLFIMSNNPEKFANEQNDVTRQRK